MFSNIHFVNTMAFHLTKEAGGGGGGGGVESIQLLMLISYHCYFIIV